MAMMFIFIYKLSIEIGQKFNFLLSLIFSFLENTITLLVFWESAGCLCHAFQISTLLVGMGLVRVSSRKLLGYDIVVETFIF